MTDATDPTGLVDGLVQLSFRVQAELADVAAEHGLSVVQTRMLGILRDREPLMRELAEHLGLDRSSTSGLVDRAERRGLVRRSPSTRDGRAVQVALTDAGREIARAGEAEIERRVRALTTALDDDGRAELARLAAAVVDEDAPPETHPPRRRARPLDSKNQGPSSTSRRTGAGQASDAG
ncbi:MarR family winged helix-turn-helix transcriptional regulator [Cellulomonas sp. PhB143]|uniref:MarR family winged helix-turn-helix transcriptional regulator n=1 Tax=Cellulomonas sp. PhB143 TaxID=2485186 RepID=UPI000F4AB4FF|nr:MarR family transcriptional regulator [Cellulomonas sp. PhB143]ROS75428.1 DNA-binding MarR family transcriptional regulator [Cellulomonas sp. PhB143]